MQSAQKPSPIAPRVRRGVDMTQESLVWGLALLAWPIVLSFALTSTVGIADMKMVGYVGWEGQAAVAVAWQIVMLVFSAAMAVATGAQVLVAQRVGARDHEGADAIVKQSLLLIVALSALIVTPVGIVFARQMLAAAGATGVVLDQSAVFLRVCFIASFFYMCSFVLSGALRGAGDTITPLLIMGLVNVLNIAFDYVLIFGKLGLPAMGVAGVATGSATATTIGTLLLLGALTSRRYALRIYLRGSWVPDWATWWRILYIGVPTSLQGLTRSVAFILLIKVISLTPASQLAIAAHGVANQVRGVSVMLGLALMAAAITAVGQNVGAGLPRRAVRAAWNSVAIATALAFLAILTYALFSRQIAGFFTREQCVADLGVTALLVLGASEPFLLGSLALSGAFRGAGDTVTPLWVALLTTNGLGPAVSYLLAIPGGMGPVGAWLGFDIAAFLNWGLLIIMFRRMRWDAPEPPEA